MRNISILALYLYLLTAVCAHAQDNAKQANEATRKRVEALIEQLASRNTAPPVQGDAREGDDQTIRFPATYDRTLQTPVFCAYKALLAEDEAAIDILIEHAGDQRYSYSVNTYADYNVSVGDACSKIASAMIIGFENELDVISRSQFGVFPTGDPFDKSDPLPSVVRYWKRNNELGLAKIQILAIDATLTYFRNANGEAEPPWHPEAARLELSEFNRRREANIRTLTAIRKYVSETGRRYKTTQIDGSHDCMFGLPWAGRRFSL